MQTGTDLMGPRAREVDWKEGKDPGTFWISGLHGTDGFCLPQSATSPDPCSSFETVQQAVRP